MHPFIVWKLRMALIKFQDIYLLSRCYHALIVERVQKTEPKPSECAGARLRGSAILCMCPGAALWCIQGASPLTVSNGL